MATRPAPSNTIAPIDKHSRLSPEERAKVGKVMAKRYTAGATLRELSEESKRSYGAIQILLKEQGVTMRPRGGSRRAS